MDNFYRTENIEVFKKWVYYKVKKDSRLTLEKYDERTYKIFYKNREARFVVWPIGVIEESIKEEDTLLFYLHYQFYNFHFAVDLFCRMIEKLTEKSSTQKHTVLLCCTGGMTTGFFAEKLNKYCELNRLPYQIHAAPIYELNNIYNDYDLILIAPQLRYKVIEMAQQYKPTMVQSIDSVIFATYDCLGLITQIKKFYEEKDNE